MSRSRFRSGNNTRRERYLSVVGRRKINSLQTALGTRWCRSNYRACSRVWDRRDLA
jgi:hypothetical protein